MLTKKQLKDAARCCSGLCELCSCNKTRMAYQDCIREAAKTALAYREMLELITSTLDEIMEDDIEFTYISRGTVLEVLNRAEKLLDWKSEVKHDD